MNRRDFFATAAALPAVLPMVPPIPSSAPTARLYVNGKPYRVAYLAVPPARLSDGALGCWCEDGQGVMVFEPEGESC